MSNVRRFIAVLLLALTCLAFLEPVRAATNEVKYEQALKLLKSSANNPHAVALFEEAALEGDIKSQLMLGAILLEGKYVPQDRIKGLAYLQLVAVADYPPYRPMRDQAREWMRASQASMSGSDLIKADQFAVQWNASYKERLVADLAPALAVFTDQTLVTLDPVIRFAQDPLQLAVPPTSLGGPKFRSGCAAKARAGCPSASKLPTDARCTGVIVTADTAPSSVPSDGAKLFAPDYPLGVRRAGDGGTVKLLIHVDRSGWICGAAVAVSSGTLALDASALDTVGLWKLNPARQQSNPVEALHTVAITFRIQT